MEAAAAFSSSLLFMQAALGFRFRSSKINRNIIYLNEINERYFEV